MYIFSTFNTTERALLRNINPLSKQDTNAEGARVLFALRVCITQHSPLCRVKSTN